MNPNLDKLLDELLWRWEEDGTETAIQCLPNLWHKIEKYRPDLKEAQEKADHYLSILQQALKAHKKMQDFDPSI